jgi:hypothetical protein
MTMKVSTIVRSSCALLLLAGAGLTTVGPAAAEERTCRGTIGAVVLDNLRVPQGATCTLNGTRLQGTIKVEGGATLNASTVRVNGNVQGEGARSVTVLDSRVGGSIQLVQGQAANIRRQHQSACRGQQHRRRKRAGFPEHRRCDCGQEPDRRKPAVQGELTATHRRQQRGAGQQGRSVPRAVIHPPLGR